MIQDKMNANSLQKNTQDLFLAKLDARLETALWECNPAKIKKALMLGACLPNSGECLSDLDDESKAVVTQYQHHPLQFLTRQKAFELTQRQLNRFVREKIPLPEEFFSILPLLHKNELEVLFPLETWACPSGVKTLEALHQRLKKKQKNKSNFVDYVQEIASISLKKLSLQKKIGQAQNNA